MLKIHVGHLADEILYPSAYFDNNFEDAWFEDPFVKKIIHEIDEAEAQSPYQITSYKWGGINYSMLSTGAKNLILAYKTSKPIYATKMGDNCSNLLLQIAEMKDLTITLTHIMDFNHDFDAYFINTSKLTHTRREYIFEMVDLLEQSGSNL